MRRGTCPFMEELLFHLFESHHTKLIMLQMLCVPLLENLHHKPHKLKLSSTRCPCMTFNLPTRLWQTHMPTATCTSGQERYPKQSVICSGAPLRWGDLMVKNHALFQLSSSQKYKKPREWEKGVYVSAGSSDAKLWLLRIRKTGSRIRAGG